MDANPISNPFKPGAGHMPPYLAGRETEKEDFAKRLAQDTILENLILTGLRGVGKTVLLETVKPIAIERGWLWIGTDLSESTSVDEARLAIRLMTDVSVVTSRVPIAVTSKTPVGLTAKTEEIVHTLDFETLHAVYQATPGLAGDKLKAVLELVWETIRPLGKRGVIFAYDEAQNLADHATRHEFPLSLLLDTFMSIQRKGVPFMLALTGLPTLFPKLVESRTYAERMFHVIQLDRLNESDSREAISRPVEMVGFPFRLTPETIDRIVAITRGYPFFIQYVCREVFDVIVQAATSGHAPPPVPEEAIIRKLDSDFFAGRWARATDRQRDLLRVIATLATADAEFTVQEITAGSASVLDKPFSPSHVNQMLVALSAAGLVYKNRWGRYSLAVPLLDEFIRRQSRQDTRPAN